MSTFDQKSVIEAILYILSRADRPVTKYQLVKILYFADLLHLRRYGRTITGDWYTAMEFGPVPSQSFELLKPLYEPSRLDAGGIREVLARGANKNEAIAVRPPNEDFLSESEKECLDEVTTQLLDMSFGEIVDKSHGLAWERAHKIAQERGAKASKILTEWIIEELGDSVAQDEGEEAGREWVEQITEYLNEYAT